jgi:sulfofructose kinase
MPLTAFDVVGFGESSVDYVYVVPELPRAGGAKLPISHSFVSAGGQVATALAACATFGLRCAYLGPVGDDSEGRYILDALREKGVDVTLTITRPAKTRSAVILVDEATGERAVFWQRDASLNVPADVDLSARARVLFVDGTDEASAIRLAARAAGAGTIVTCDIDTVSAGTAELLRHVTMPILAEHVPQAITGQSDPERALRELKRPDQRLACVTLGPAGAAALDQKEFVYEPAVHVNAVDTTSAGDVFRAAFIYGVLHDWPTTRTLRFANAAAAVACTRRGAISSVPGLKEVLRLAQ